MHTEDEARKLWCPMVRFVIGPETSKWQGVAYTNRCQELNTDKVNCIASACMMWQWVDDEFEYLFSPPENDEWTPAPYLSGEGRKCDRWQREKKNRRGFCGLSRPFYIPTGNCGGGKP